MLAHDVYFSLTIIAGGQGEADRRLQEVPLGHPGMIWFAAGPVGEEFQRM